MRKKKVGLWVLGVCLALIAALVLPAVQSGKLTLPVPKKERFELSASDAEYLPRLRLDGKTLVNDAGETVILQGIMVPEPRKLRMEGKLTREYFEEVFALGVNALRIPVHPDAWEQDEYYLWRYLDPAVEWAVQSGVYVILDLHCIGNIRTGDGEQMPSGNAEEYAVSFWRAVSSYFRDVPNVLFEIYNEPALIDSNTWAQYATLLVDTIRETGCEQVIIVSGTDYAYDLRAWREHPLEDENILYSAHIFPNRHGTAELSKNAEDLPVIVTEWGYIAQDEPAAQRYLIGARETYAVPMLTVMREKKIGWIACWYDDGWEPPMLRKDGEGWTDWGEFVLDALE